MSAFGVELMTVSLNMLFFFRLVDKLNCFQLIPDIKWKSQNDGSLNKKLQFARESVKFETFEIAIFFYPYSQWICRR